MHDELGLVLKRGAYVRAADAELQSQDMWSAAAITRSLIMSRHIRAGLRTRLVLSAAND